MDHITEGIERLIEQYKEKPNFLAVLNTLLERVQTLEDQFDNLILGRWLDNVSGDLLDKFGSIVGQDRFGLSDDDYRILIYIQIGRNNSEGRISDIANIYQLITGATKVHLVEAFPASIYLLSDGDIEESKANFIYEKLSEILSAGVRLDNIGKFDPNKPFAFAGFPNASTFGDINDPDVGGCFAYFYDIRLNFGFSYIDPDSSTLIEFDNLRGLSDLDDPFLGGIFKSL